jgi:hypothetical protein
MPRFELASGRTLASILTTCKQTHEMIITQLSIEMQKNGSNKKVSQHMPIRWFGKVANMYLKKK